MSRKFDDKKTIIRSCLNKQSYYVLNGLVQQECHWGIKSGGKKVGALQGQIKIKRQIKYEFIYGEGGNEVIAIMDTNG